MKVISFSMIPPFYFKGRKFGFLIYMKNKIQLATLHPQIILRG